MCCALQLLSHTKCHKTCTFALRGDWQQCLHIQISIESQKSVIESSGCVKQEATLHQFPMLSIMPRMSREDRERAIDTLVAGMSCANVAWHVNVSQSTLSCSQARFQQTSRTVDRPRSGRPRVTTPAQDQYIRLSHQRDHYRPATQTAAATLGTHNVHISPRTVWTDSLLLVSQQDILTEGLHSPPQDVVLDRTGADIGCDGLCCSGIRPYS